MNPSIIEKKKLTGAVGDGGIGVVRWPTCWPSWTWQDKGRRALEPISAAIFHGPIPSSSIHSKFQPNILRMNTRRRRSRERFVSRSGWLRISSRIYLWPVDGLVAGWVFHSGGFQTGVDCSSVLLSGALLFLLADRMKKKRKCQYLDEENGQHSDRETIINKRKRTRATAAASWLTEWQHYSLQQQQMNHLLGTVHLFVLNWFKVFE